MLINYLVTRLLYFFLFVFYLELKYQKAKKKTKNKNQIPKMEWQVVTTKIILIAISA